MASEDLCLECEQHEHYGQWCGSSMDNSEILLYRIRISLSQNHTFFQCLSELKGIQIRIFSGFSCMVVVTVLYFTTVTSWALWYLLNSYNTHQLAVLCPMYTPEKLCFAAMMGAGPAKTVLFLTWILIQLFRHFAPILHIVLLPSVIIWSQIWQ